MRRAVLGIVLGAATGILLGAVARGLMRLLAIGMSMEPEFHLGATIAIVSLFVVSAAGAAAARAFGLTGWRAALAILGSSAPLLLMSSAFATGEIQELLDRNLTLPWRIELLAMAGVIILVVLLTPYAGWRSARRPVPAPTQVRERSASRAS